jgi:hypothetical protein
MEISKIEKKADMYIKVANFQPAGLTIFALLIASTKIK